MKNILHFIVEHWDAIGVLVGLLFVRSAEKKALIKKLSGE